ncbi:MAG: ATP-binding cassette domain-containing protein [Defluviitaleaceae bacterium]|nr:ATP-binding cassette domain-containing protein [Defluviitaleaceae bacterium]
MKHFKSVISKHRALIAMFILMGILWTFLQNFAPLYFQTVVDNFANGTLSVKNIAVYGTALILLYFMGYLINYPWVKLSRSIQQSLKLIALQKISVIDYQSYTKLGTGALIQRIENGASAGKGILFDFFLRFIGELLPSMVFSIIFVFFINRAVMVVIVSGYVIVFTIFAILVGFVKIGVIIYGWVTGELTIGQIVALLLLVDNAYQPIAIFNVDYVAYNTNLENHRRQRIAKNGLKPPIFRSVADVIFRDSYKLDKVAFARFAEFLDSKEDDRLLQGGTLHGLKGDISFSGVGFSYGEREILSNLSLDIENGKSIAFVGESGCGKSTMVKLLAGLLQPSRGTVALDNFDLGKINLNSYYKYIAYLSQEPSVFNGTLRENLVFDEIVDDNILVDALTNAGLDGLLAKLDNGLDTPLGEKGISLSGGERQQLALARLWFSGAEIIILDEATSAIDNLSEELVMKNVLALFKVKTIIAVAHRLDSIRDFDEIILFQNGQIAEQGHFTDLIGRGQLFYELYNRLQL